VRLSVVVSIDEMLRLERMASTREVPVSVLARELILASLAAAETDKPESKEAKPDVETK